MLNLEGTAANDLGCVEDQFKVCRPTQGVAVSFMDGSSIGQRKLFKEILDLAEHEHIAGILSQLIDTLGEDRARALTDGINEAVSALEHIV